jgi:hypothetical protein
MNFGPGSEEKSYLGALIDFHSFNRNAVAEKAVWDRGVEQLSLPVSK